VIKEDTGVCYACKRGDHERCELVVSGGDYSGATFCSCQCTGTSLGAAPGAFEKVPQRVKKQFPTFPKQPGTHDLSKKTNIKKQPPKDPLAHLF
jgi:hypothetical protein